MDRRWYEKMCGRLTCCGGEEEEEARSGKGGGVMILKRQLCCRTRGYVLGVHFGLAIFWACKRGWGGNRVSDFVAFDVSYAVQEVSKTASQGTKNGTLCFGNERCAVEYRPVATLNPPGNYTSSFC